MLKMIAFRHVPLVIWYENDGLIDNKFYNFAVWYVNALSFIPWGYALHLIVRTPSITFSRRLRIFRSMLLQSI